jgi:hypothetical protein
MITPQNYHGHFVAELPQWEGAEDRAVVPEWLNAARDTESYMRVLHLMGEIRDVADEMDRMRWWATTTEPRSKAMKKHGRELDRRHDGINQSLERYVFSPVLQRVIGGKRWMLSMFVVAKDRGDEYVFSRVVDRKEVNADGRVVSERHLEHTIGEGDVVLRILNLAAASELERVQPCGKCYKWFYAGRSHQRFCSEECRVAHYSSSPKYKKSRKEYMRRYRAKE